MKKKLLMMLMCGVMALSLCACGGSENGGDANDKTEQVGNADKNDKDAPKEAIKKTYETINYMNGEVATSALYEYDEKGREISQKLKGYGAEPDQETIATTTWEEKGNISLGTLSTGKPEETMNIEMEYNEDGKVVSVVKKQGDRVVSKQTNTYKNGELSEMRMEVTPTPSMNQITVYKYEKNNITYTEVVFNEEMKNKSSYEYTYNAKGDVEKAIATSTIYVADGTENVFTSTTEYKYDENGVLSELVQEDGSRQVLKYDENGNLLEQCVYNANGEMTSKQTYTYY